MEGGMNSGSEWEAVFEMWLQDGEGANEPGTFPKELSAGQPESDLGWRARPDHTTQPNISRGHKGCLQLIPLSNSDRLYVLRR